MNGEHVYAWQKFTDKMDKLIEMNHKDLLNPYEIEKQIGILSDDLKRLFEHHNIKLNSAWDIAKIKRKKDFKTLYKLHFQQRLSLNEIYRQYGYSQLYVKRVFKEHGLEHLGFVNQNK
ncbi:AraC family transcriptional regulator [Cytobacillus praedii]|uniref:AraC family transcriptional regulator n=1 Tax=Cytobacillus praedii TaxID=1742358 RepID=A0A4R1AQ49_9BACI|nr:AraC family transcriptional regulator [Cytobacillus praedii]TCJ01608.1 AraC family transcriptional regulator [Cytobacillus praedii]